MSSSHPFNAPKETFSVRRSEPTDAKLIEKLFDSTSDVFGRIHVPTLLEKANLAVTVTNEKNEIVAHASFCDYPNGDLVDQSIWEHFLHKYFKADQYTYWNTLFLHLFVTKCSSAFGVLKEVIRAAFGTVPTLEHLCLLSTHVPILDFPLQRIFRSAQRRMKSGPQCWLFACNRKHYYPRLHIRKARILDHDYIMDIFEEETSLSIYMDEPLFLVNVIESESWRYHSVVFEADGVVVGFITITEVVEMKASRGHGDLKKFHCLRQFDGFFKGKHKRHDSYRYDSMHSERESHHSAQQSDEVNAFRILFFITDKSSKIRALDCLPYIFQNFPQVEYCVITTLPVNPELPFLRSFYRVPLGAVNPPPCELYLLHRSGLGAIKVRLAMEADRHAVNELVKGLKSGPTLLKEMESYFKNSDAMPLQIFVAVLGNQVVGITIINDELDVEFICAHYNIESFINFNYYRYEEHGHIRHFFFKPLLRVFTKYFFRDVLRMSHKSCLYYKAYPPFCVNQISCAQPLDLLLDCSVPVSPRRQIIYPLEELGINTPSKQVLEEQDPFSLNLITRKLSMEPRININARVVVVGASDTGLALLEALCSRPHLKFNNLILISTHGFPGDDEDVGFLSTSHAYSKRDLAKTHLHYSIHVVTGKITTIKRKSKCVFVSGGEKVPYNFLILCTGLQYTMPCTTPEKQAEPLTHAQMQLQELKQKNTTVIPSNFFTLNNARDCMAVRTWLLAEFVDKMGDAIVYGNNIDVYVTVETLLNLGIAGYRVHLVLPPPEPGFVTFPDSAVEAAVVTALNNACVHVHSNFVLDKMNNGNHPDPLTSVSFTGDSEQLDLQCEVFINLSNKDADYDSFKSMSTAFLVYDGRLVINKSFLTNDKSIYGAGPVTKFSRRYYSNEWTHANFNSKEVGQELATTLLAKLDPVLEKPTEEPPPTEMDKLIPMYKQAKVVGGRLPGGYNFLFVTKPCPREPDDIPPQPNTQIVTGQAETGNYFCLHLDHRGLVEAIICLSFEFFPVSNYLTLYGKHQKLLGQLLRQFNEGEITDLYSFFKESWCLPVFLDRYSDFEGEIRDLVTVKPMEEVSATEQSKDEASDSVLPMDDSETANPKEGDVVADEPKADDSVTIEPKKDDSDIVKSKEDDSDAAKPKEDDLGAAKPKEDDSDAAKPKEVDAGTVETKPKEFDIDASLLTEDDSSFIVSKEDLSVLPPPSEDSSSSESSPESALSRSDQLVLRKATTRFLAYNKNLLPMFASPEPM